MTAGIRAPELRSASRCSDSASEPRERLQFGGNSDRYGKSVRYAQDKTAHVKTEFGFDTVQVEKNRYASQQYHDFIGFQVSKPLLERVFPVVYGMELRDVLTHEDVVVGSYPFAVSRLIPQMTQVALQTHKKDLMRETPDFKKLQFNNPTPQTEDLYFKSINTSVDQYRAFLEAVRTGLLVLHHCDLDTGNQTKAAEYSLTDDTYAQLLSQLTDRKFNLTSADLRANILDFYSDLSAPIETKKDNARWQNVLVSLDQLKLVTSAPVVTDGPAQLVRGLSEATVRPGAPVPPAIVIGFVGGFIRRDNLVHSEVQLAARLRKAYPLGVDVETFESYCGQEARKKVLDLLDANRDGTLTSDEKQNAHIIIYGHGWGGSEAIDLARELERDGIPVLLTIQVDSISSIHRNDELIPANVAQAANFYQSNGLLHGQSEIRAADPIRRCGNKRSL